MSHPWENPFKEASPSNSPPLLPSIGMKVVFHEGVKRLVKYTIRAGCVSALWVLLAAICLPSPLMAGKEAVQAGGRPGQSRVVFYLETLVIPRLTQEDQSLIVNFPDTIGEPVSITDSFMIGNLSFDGRTARITMKHPFEFSTSFTEKPAQYVIDIREKKEAQAVCPIGDIQAKPNNNGITVELFIQNGMWPEIRYAKNRRVFLIFKGEINCPDIEKKIARVPSLKLEDSIKIQGGTGLAISIVDGQADVEVKAEEKSNRIVLDINTSGRMSRSNTVALAQKSLEQNDMASAIHALEYYKDSLTSQENIILGEAYWKIAYPYYMEAYSMKALKHMSAGLQAMTPGIRREEIMLDYLRMLNHARMFTEAEKYIKFLKDSLDTGIAAEAHLIGIDILNNRKMFQDAFVENRRMLSVFEKEGIPQNLNAYYNSVLADTYLGLNAYPRALKLYRTALTENPGLFTSDPGLYARMGEAAYNSGDYTTAKDYLLLAINLSRKEDKAPYLISLGDCLYQLGQTEKAMGVLSEVENMSPDSQSDVIARLKTARMIQEKDLEKNNGKLSDKAFHQIVYIYEDLKSTKEYEEGPLGSIIKIRLAQTYAKRNEWDNALDAYLTAWISTKKNDPIHKYAQGEAEKALAVHLENLETLGKYDRIWDTYLVYEDSFMKDLKSPEALFALGKAMNELGYLDQAHAMLLACIKTASAKTNQALSILFSIDYRKADYAAALVWNTRYLQGYPQGKDFVKMQAIRGEILYRTDHFAEAVPFLEHSIRQGGERTLFDLLYLANTYNKLGKQADEDAALDRIVSYADFRKSPVIEKALYARANRLKQTGNLPRARELYTRLLNTYPQTSLRDWAFYHLALVYHGEGNDEEATKLLTSLIQQSKDKTLLRLANNSLGEVTLDSEIHEYTRFIDRFGGK